MTFARLTAAEAAEYRKRALRSARPRLSDSSDGTRERHVRYNTSAKGRERSNRYEQSTKGRETRASYEASLSRRMTRTLWRCRRKLERSRALREELYRVGEQREGVRP